MAVQVFGVKLLGFDTANGRKALFSAFFLVGIWLLGRLLKWLFSRKDHREERRAFWVRQGISIIVAVLNILVLLSIWFDDPTRLATAFGLVTAVSLSHSSESSPPSPATS
ncbi:MAG TPA: hypothetical protein VGM43_13050 [Bryobacteraceae bacterium]|jgi:small-conductance mechanosensitive channel